MSIKIMPDLRYAKTDEWVRVEGEEAVIGISDYAQDALSDIVYVCLLYTSAHQSINLCRQRVISIRITCSS